MASDVVEMEKNYRQSRAVAYGKRTEAINLGERLFEPNDASRRRGWKLTSLYFVATTRKRCAQPDILRRSRIDRGRRDTFDQFDDVACR
jgi:hypothetical protein